MYNASSMIEIARGKIAGMSAFNKFGRITALGQTQSTIWSAGDGGLYSYLTSETELFIASSSANDTGGGSGAIDVKVYYLNGSYNMKTSQVNLAGQTKVSVATDIFRVYRMEILSTGAGGTNAGNIWLGSGTFTSGVPANKYAVIDAGKGRTLQTMYTVPAGYDYLITMGYASVSPVSGALRSLEIELYSRPVGGSFAVGFTVDMASGVYPQPLTPPLRIPEKTDIEVRGVIDSGNVDVSAGYLGVLVETAVAG